MMSCRSLLICGSFFSALVAFPGSAQLIPDNTLGAETTIITPLDDRRDRIDGGAIRDINLFHSFREFNVDNGRSVYFSTPLGVENILTRVTGNNLSAIMGHLGVIGEANLFLLNPNGIILGENATLDIRGSFLATTADSIQLGNNGFFSATDIADSQLLSVQPGALFSNALSNHQARIENRGNLQVGGNLTLDSDILTLEGQLQAEGDLILNATDTVTLRDSTTQEFIATAGGEMRIQGNQSVDIFILNHPDSGLYSGSNIILRSANPVIGDAHYQTGGNFRVEALDGSLGSFYSPNDPVVYANGDFSLNNYSGASLHVLAGGSINIPLGIFITGPDTVGNSINPTSTPHLATVTTSDGQTITIDGSAEPTLDLRAGIDWAQLGGFPGNFTVGTGEFDFIPNSTPPATAYSPTATSADINVGTMFVFDPGQVFLTNQYIPNTALNGNITVADIFNDGGDVTLDSKGNINVGGLISVDGVLPTDDAGNVKLLAANDITFSGGFNGIFASGQRSGSIILNSQGNTVLNNSLILAETAASTADSIGNDINITAQNLTATNGTQIYNDISSQGNAGKININVRDAASFDNSFVRSDVSTGSIGNGGELKVSAGSLTVINDSLLLSSTSGQGNAGKIDINVRDAVVFDYSVAASAVLPGGIGNGGEVKVSAGSLAVINASEFTSATYSQGNAGNVNINVRDAAVFDGGVVLSAVLPEATGSGGEVTISAGSLTVINASELGSGTLGQGNAGNVNINVRDAVFFDDSTVGSTVLPEATGNGSELQLSAGSLTLINNSLLLSGTFGQGNAGKININVRDAASFDSSFVTSNVFSGATGNGGAVTVSAGSLTVIDDSQLSSGTFGQGNAGNININVRDAAFFDSSFVRSDVFLGATGNGGELKVSAGSLTVIDASQFISRTSSQGNGGNVNINVRDRAVFDNSIVSSGVEIDAVGNSGQVNLASGSLTVRNGASISAATAGQGNAGNMMLNVRGEAVFEGNQSGAFSNVGANAVGNGGRVTVNSGSLRLRDGATVSSSAAGVGVAGDIAINTGVLSLESSRILTETRSGDGGNIALNVDGILVLRNGSLISTTAGSTGVDGNGGNIDIRAEFVIGVPGENSDITANAFEGQGGNILITTNGIYGLRFRNELTPLSDITASSKFGLNGTFTLNLLSFPAEQGVNELPGALVDAEGLVGRDICAVQNRQIAGGSSFVVVGRGGLPPNLTELMTPMEGTVEWATRAQTPATVSVRARNEPLANQAIQQMQGWVVAPEGTVLLTAVAPTAAMGSQGYAYPTCASWQGE